jgi:hypothetical protein
VTRKCCINEKIRVLSFSGLMFLFMKGVMPDLLGALRVSKPWTPKRGYVGR